jgi:hypothetical protein
MNTKVPQIDMIWLFDMLIWNALGLFIYKSDFIYKNYANRSDKDTYTTLKDRGLSTRGGWIGEYKITLN